MENQADQREISRSGISFVIFCIISGWILDVLSSFIGKSLGGAEIFPFFEIFPAAWMLMLIILAAFVYKFRRAPFWLRGSILLWLIAFSFLPALRNTAIILGVVFE